MRGKAPGSKAVAGGGGKSGTLTRNHWTELNQTLGRGCRRLGLLGDRRNERFCAPYPELCQFSSYKAFLQKKRNISGTAEAIASKMVSSESSRRVGSESRKARGKARRLWRYRVCELEGRRRRGLPSKSAPSRWAPDVKLRDGDLGDLPEVSWGDEKGSVRPKGARVCLVESGSRGKDKKRALKVTNRSR
ncbi:hypothetical protein EDD15DRAFT_1548750 [Pisolithus albus]|nr:hypothetical protein EDD15DRAFT_1548750 [Pisolithus albus]